MGTHACVGGHHFCGSFNYDSHTIILPGLFYILSYSEKYRPLSGSPVKLGFQQKLEAGKAVTSELSCTSPTPSLTQRLPTESSETRARATCGDRWIKALPPSLMCPFSAPRPLPLGLLWATPRPQIATPRAGRGRQRLLSVKLSRCRQWRLLSCTVPETGQLQSWQRAPSPR